MSEPEQCVAAEIMLLEAEAKIDQLAKEVLKLDAENQRLNKVINEMIKPFITRL
jgi:outer membrane murein-binding lipoprotein Lpp